MVIYVLRKLAFFIGAVFVASVAIFLLLRAAGGNVAAIVLGKDANYFLRQPAKTPQTGNQASGQPA